MITLKEKADRLRKEAIGRYTKICGENDVEMWSEKRISEEPLEDFCAMVDHICALFGKNVTRCNTCRHLHISTRWKERFGTTEDNREWMSCDHYVNPKWKTGHGTKTEHVRMPSHKACPNYEYSEDNYINRRRNK